METMDFYGFYTGKEMEAYRYLGCHLKGEDAYFRTFAPNAKEISVIGSFSNWTEIPMKKVYDGNFWECNISRVSIGDAYKYRIYKEDGTFMDHCDPYGFWMVKPPETASRVSSLEGFQWSDGAWLKKRTDCKRAPLNIYEVHLGSWKKKRDDTWFSYREISEPLIRYVKENGFNYIEIMPLAEHPCDNSWGYQQTGYYSPTSRYGEPDDLRALINKAHDNDIGVILDFVPVHFAVDDFALANYDGTSLYEYPHVDVGVSEWGSRNFNHSRGEVQSFLQSNALYWLKEFHFDGLRMDALSNLIYWQGSEERGVNLRTVEFIQYMNQTLKSYDPSIILIAEDSSAFKGVTKPVTEGGLGFDYKWDLGWMHDTLTLFQTAPEYRSRDYHKLTFSMMYFKNENYLLPLSHDEVVHGKATILQKMWGDYEVKFPQARLLYLYMFTHPGKKLNFMGNEIGQFREWDEKREQDWGLLSYPKHKTFSNFIKDLGCLYQEKQALYEKEYDGDGFRWINCAQEAKCLYLYERKCDKESLIIVLNLSDQVQTYQWESQKELHLLMDTDDKRYGGTSTSEKEEIEINQSMILQPFSGKVYRVNN